MNIYWASWETEQEFDETKFPPNDQVIGYWYSGYGEIGDIICAYVVANDESSATKAIRQTWPDFYGDYRFIEIEECFYSNSRFAYKEGDWVHQRILKACEEHGFEIREV